MWVPSGMFLCGFHMDSMSIPYGFQVDSMWNPCLFQMYSRWNTAQIQKFFQVKFKILIWCKTSDQLVILEVLFTTRECHRFVTPCRCNQQASAGTGMGWNLMSLVQPVPMRWDSQASVTVGAEFQFIINQTHRWWMLFST
jgi:hypothetical protein